MNSRYVPVATIVFLVFAVFCSAIGFEFTSYDDGGHIQENPAVQNLDLKKIWSEPYFGMYIPVTYTFWGIVRQITDHPAAFHALNVLFHVANAVLVFWLLSQWGFRTWASVSGALFFALHPVQVESVAWISSFRDVLSAFWGLLFLNFVFRSQENWKTFFLATLPLFLSILSKPSGVVFAVVPGLYWFWQSRRPKPILFIGTAVWITFAAALAVLAKSIQPIETLVQNPSWGERIAILAKALAFYSWKLLDGSGLSPDYGLSTTSLIAEWSRVGFPVLQTLLVLVGLATTVYFFWKRKPVALGLMIAILFVAPYLGLVPFNFQNVSIVADRYLYLSVIGIALALSVLEPKQQNKISFGINTVVWLVVIFFTYKQLGVWKNDRTLYTEMLETNSQSYMGHNGMGVLEMEAKRFQPAVEHLQKAVAINPGYYFARYNLARALELAGDPMTSLNQYVQTINGQPNFVPAYHGLAALLYNQQRYAEAQEAAIRGLALQPENSGLNNLRSQIQEQLKRR